MAPQVQVNGIGGRALQDVLKEIEQTLERERAANNFSSHDIKDLRWQFDQVSAKMNQAIYNDQFDKVHETCLQTVVVLMEILARS